MHVECVPFKRTTDASRCDWMAFAAIVIDVADVAFTVAAIDAVDDDERF